MKKEKPIVVITGASSGIGKAVAKRLGLENYPLILIARRKERLEALQKEISSTLNIFSLDVSQHDKVQNTFLTIEKRYGTIGILINNAGCGFGLEPAYKSNLEEWKQCIDVNIKGLLYCTHAVLPSMVEKNQGHIINLGSIAGTYPYPGGNVYGATKAFVHQFSLNLKADLLGTNVRVSCIEPGLTAGTEFSLVRFRGDEKKAASPYENTNPLQAEDIAEAIHFCIHAKSHININTIEIMPVAQASASLAVFRDSIRS